MAAPLVLLGGGVGNILQQMNLKEASRPIYLGEPAISIALGAPRKKPSQQILSSTQLPTILGRTTKISAPTDAHRA